ncbi:MAG: Uma2 family endonuclease [Tepidiformaceae bacterium]
MTTRTLTIDEFLALPETEPPSEYIRGEVIQRPGRTPAEAFLVIQIGARLARYLEERSTSVVFLGAAHVDRVNDRVFLPDINVTVRSRLPKGAAAWRRAFEMTPDFAIEVLSPDDRPGRVLDRITFLLNAGVRLIWFVDPDDETVTAYRPGETPQAYRPPSVIDARPVLSDFALHLGEIFGGLRDEVEGSDEE